MQTLSQELSPPQSEALRGSILPLIRLAARSRKLIGYTAVSIVVLGLISALFLPKRYKAVSVILPPQGGSAGAAMMAQLGNLGGMASAAGGLGIKNPNDLQVALLKSASVENAMVERFHLQSLYHRKYLSSTRKRWENASSIDNGLKDGLIRLSVTDSDPRRAAELTNGWVEEYRRLSVSIAVTEASQRRRFFERQLTSARVALAAAEEDLKKTEQRTGVIDLEGQAHAMIASATLVRAQVASKEVEIQAMREFAADQNPDLLRAEQELRSMERQLASMDVESDRQAGDLVVPKGKVTQGSLDYARALRDVKYQETMVELLSRQYEGARVDEARQGAQVQVIDPATVPDHPDSLYRILILLLTVLGALPLALLTAVAAELVAILRRYRSQSGSWSGALEEIIAGVAR